MDRKNGPCRICNDPETTSSHFGAIVCTACASFFGRTTVDKFRCIANNKCVISCAKKITCRSCRYDSCIRAGMNKFYTRKIKAPKQQVIQEVDRNETFQKSETSSNINYAMHGFSKVLNLQNDEILQFYVKEVEKSLSQKKRNCSKNILNAESINDLLIISAHHTGSAMESCFQCPGINLLEKEDIQVFLRYFEFSNVWIDSLREYSLMSHSHNKEISRTDKKVMKFINQVKSTLGTALIHLKLNIYEFAAFKSFCIWNIKFHKTSRIMRIVAQSHYMAVSFALRMYYKNQLKLSDMEIAIRIGDITLQIATVSTIYHDLIRLYQDVGRSL
ncbi:Nuclear receptor domain-containing protein [Caenorhabditis elegans]|uniref:Nuclear receptor domain-containing protein n=1 Tax=Caenorhabditis elegans TaxID=6239 RepID=O16603_CAEEL|nr:Nuclear receptor domain-containing protein [Caenorhabditis elegans]CCD64803.1 Nuclear receptor domain-containing protein [Caenorhabditis elegans]|eukprot:NP_494675.3 Nuclear Hormone Receptor family [Caenorhabditis elegans]